MGLARDITELSDGIRREPRVELFRPIEDSGLLEYAESSAILNRMVAQGWREGGKALRLCLQSLQIQDESMRASLFEAEFVATLPTGTPGIARQTATVATEMLDSAKKEIIFLSYEFSDRNLIETLIRTASRGVDIVIICDRGRKSAREVLKAWPRKLLRPRIFHDKKRVGGPRYASLHAKCILVDGMHLLVTSANFTFHGLHGNIEVGVRLSGPPAGEARKLFSYLVENRIVEEMDSQI